MIFTSEKRYLQSCATLESRIAAIDRIIEALLLNSEASASGENIQEYWLNDGQTQIKTIYRGQAAIDRAIQGYERLRQTYLQRITGRVTILMDSKNFRGA